MKRCPQCEFIYEDDQSLCDMDGVLLVLDSRALPNLHALATVPPVPKSQRRNRAVPAFATLVLALVLGTVYYVLTQRSANIPPIPLSSSITIPVAQEQPPAAAAETSNAEQPAKEEAAKPKAAKASVKKATTKSVTASQTKTSAPEKKNDSKVNSILKKTGRILKKPFKF